MVIPGVIFGIGLYFLYHLAGFELGLGAVLPAHIVWAMPFGLILMLARFDPALASCEEVARTLGAGGWKVFREITMPLIFPQIVATALFAFVLSWSEVIRSKILLSGGWSTLPVYIYNQLTSQPMTPKFYALGAMTVFVSVTILVIAGLLMTRGTSRLF
jgi:putative spermidine/putrescine transport system permease protein